MQKNSKKQHPTDIASGSGTKAGTRSTAAAKKKATDPPLKPSYKPVPPRKKKSKDAEPTSTTQPTPTAPTQPQSSVQGSNVTNLVPNTAGPTTRGRKRARQEVGTQESTI